MDDWTATGDAFALVKGDVVPGQAPDKKGGKASGYWVSSNTGGGVRKGTLTSVPFRVTQPYASFLVSGGAFTSTRVDVLLAPVPSQGDNSDPQVIFTISGANNPTLRPVVVDLKSFVGRDIMIRLVDDETGQTVAAYLKESPWAHINFDHFRFHDTQTVLPHRDHVVGDQHAAADGPDPVRRSLGVGSREGDDRAQGVHGQACRLGARRHSADWLRARRSRAPLGRRGAHLSAARARGTGPGSHSDLRGHERRRAPRQPEGLHRGPEPHQRHRSRASAACGSAPRRI